jgi:hypothetical protein
MKKAIPLLFFVFIISSCGKKESPQDFIQNKSGDYRSFDFESSDVFFDFMKESFESEHLAETSEVISTDHIRINFTEVIEECESCVGVCISWGDNREIHILREFWDASNDATREMLVFHELGHCSLGRDHLNDTVNGNPVSIMNSFIFTSQTYLDYMAAYINELMTKDDSLIRGELD